MKGYINIESESRRQEANEEAYWGYQAEECEDHQDPEEECQVLH